MLWPGHACILVSVSPRAIIMNTSSPLSLWSAARMKVERPTLLPLFAEKSRWSKGAVNIFKVVTSRYLLCFLKKLKCVFASSNGPVLLFKTIFRRWNFYLSSVSTDGKDGHGLKLEKFGPTFSSFEAMAAKITRNVFSLVLSDLYFLPNSTGAFCVWVKALLK